MGTFLFLCILSLVAVLYIGIALIVAVIEAAAMGAILILKISTIFFIVLLLCLYLDRGLNRLRKYLSRLERM